MPVRTRCSEYVDALERVKLVRDFSAGDFAVKRGDYLPHFIPPDPDRQKQYRDKAYVLGLTGRTKESLVGMIFRKEAEVEVPDAMLPLLENIDGSGQSITQVAKQAASEVMMSGRHIFLVDYPNVEETLDAETEGKLALLPSVLSYMFEDLINWKTATINGNTMLTLAVLRENTCVAENEFEHKYSDIYRVLRLRDGVYTQQVFDADGKPASEEYIPRMAGGRPFNHIPLHIIGSQNNLPDVDIAPLYQLAIINKAHYQTTADHRENLFLHGQLTLGISTKLDFESFIAANPDGVRVGARSGHFLGEGGAFTIATAPESSSLRVALQDLEAQAVSIGAQLVQRGGQAETAEAARINAGAEASALDTLTGNLSEGIEAALEDAALFLGADADSIRYELNTSFWESELSAQDLQVVMAARMQGLFPTSDALNMVRSGRIALSACRTNEEIMKEAADEQIDLPTNNWQGQL